MSKLGSLYITLGEPEGELCGCTCEVGDWAADEIERLQDELDAEIARRWEGNRIASEEHDYTVAELRAELASVKGSLDEYKADFAALRAELRTIDLALNDERINNTMTTAAVAQELRAELDALKATPPSVPDTEITNAELDRCKKEMLEIADRYVTPSVPDAGPWKASDSGREIQSDDFTHDVMLSVTGDFEDDGDRKRYSDALAMVLNAAAPKPGEPT